MKKLLLFYLLLPIFSFAQNEYIVKPKKNIEEVSSLKKSSFMENFPYLKITDWKPGMRFMSDPNIETKNIELMKVYPKVYNQKNFSSKEFIFKKLEQREYDCPRGKCFKTYAIFDCEGDIYEYGLYGDTIELKNENRSTYVPDLIYLDEVDKARELLLTKVLYIMTSEWRTMDIGDREETIYNNPKYIQVKIIKIGLGTQDGPVKMIFSPENSTKEYCLNVRFSGVNKSMSGIFGIDFNEAFQFNNPKLNYPKISASTWSLIQKGKVVSGMSKKECELSWGVPQKINRTISGNILSEQWVYSTSSYLYFKNGVLTTIQN